MIWSLNGRSVDGCYPIIYADPPWLYRDKGGPGGIGGAAAHYPLMKTADICKLPVGALAAPDCTLFCWATYPTLPDFFEVIKAWGFTFKTIGFQWVKTYKTGTPRFGLGHWTRGNTEPCFIATRGKPHRVDNAVSQLMVTGEEVIAHEIGKHSEKPAETRDKILKLMGDLPAVELFARQRAPGWDHWGNEIKEDALKLETL